jgi:hypothetical protein
LFFLAFLVFLVFLHAIWNILAFFPWILVSFVVSKPVPKAKYVIRFENGYVPTRAILSYVNRELRGKNSSRWNFHQLTIINFKFLNPPGIFFWNKRSTKLNTFTMSMWWKAKYSETFVIFWLFSKSFEWSFETGPYLLSNSIILRKFTVRIFPKFPLE